MAMFDCDGGIRIGWIELDWIWFYTFFFVVYARLFYLYLVTISMRIKITNKSSSKCEEKKNEYTPAHNEDEKCSPFPSEEEKCKSRKVHDTATIFILYHLLRHVCLPILMIFMLDTVGGFCLEFRGSFLILAFWTINDSNRTSNYW